jgi:hypothetical protein
MTPQNQWNDDLISCGIAAASQWNCKIASMELQDSFIETAKQHRFTLNTGS